MVISIALSLETKCLVNTGQKVDFTTLLFEKKNPIDVEVDIAKDLNIAAKNIFRYLKKFVGDKIEKEEILAQNKTFFSFKRLLSPISGVIKEVDHQTGKVILEGFDNKKINNVYCFFKGEIVEIKDNEVKVKVNQGRELALKSSNFDFGGSCYYQKLSTFAQASMSTEEIEKKVYVCNSLSSYVKAKIEALGASGIVTAKQPFDNDDNFPSAQLKNMSDIEEIFKQNYTYCTVVKKNSKIYFYR